ncbi:MAG: glycosyltransferase family 10 [Algibacter sp.]
MKKILKINFTDFWPDFIKTNNYFYNLLVEKYNVVIDGNPEILFYSCFGRDYLKYKCKRVLYLGENIRPDFTACDFAFSFDYNSRKNHFRLPLYALYIDHHKLLDKLDKRLTNEEAIKAWQKKTKFCCMVVSNPDCEERISFFKNLSKEKGVDSGGRYLNNIGGPVANKMEFIRDYKFVLSFENSSHVGYTTEKIMEPILVDSIPVYWGNKKVHFDFNTNRFISYHDFKTEKDLINKLIEINENIDLGIKILQEATFSKQKISHNKERHLVLENVIQVINSKRKPIAISNWNYFHRLKLKYPITEKYLNLIGI